MRVYYLENFTDSVIVVDGTPVGSPTPASAMPTYNSLFSFVNDSCGDSRLVVDSANDMPLLISRADGTRYFGVSWPYADVPPGVCDEDKAPA